MREPTKGSFKRLLALLFPKHPHHSLTCILQVAAQAMHSGPWALGLPPVASYPGFQSPPSLKWSTCRFLGSQLLSALGPAHPTPTASPRSYDHPISLTQGTLAHPWRCHRSIPPSLRSPAWHPRESTLPWNSPPFLGVPFLEGWALLTDPDTFFFFTYSSTQAQERARTVTFISVPLSLLPTFHPCRPRSESPGQEACPWHSQCCTPLALGSRLHPGQPTSMWPLDCTAPLTKPS